MKGQMSLLFHCSVIGTGITVNAHMILSNAQYMLDKHLNHEIKESCTSDRVVGYQPVTFIVGTHIRTEGFLSIGIVQTHWMLDVRQ